MKNFSLLLLLAVSALSARAAATPRAKRPIDVHSPQVPSSPIALAAATPTPIPKGSVYVQLQQIASGLTAPGSLVSANDGTGRLFIVQQTGQILILRNGSVTPTPFLDVSSRLVGLNPGYDERGLLGFAFHPDFNNPGMPGFGKVYTYTSEPVSGAADFTVPISGSFDNQAVIAEWQVSAGNPDVIDTSTRREVMRIDHPQSNHNAGDLHFRASDHYLYIATGDGGNGNDVGPGHTANTGNAQDRSNVLGKILRIDPLHPSLTSGSSDAVSANGKYRIPASNPFVGQSGIVPEVYCYGLRNPYRFNFDAATNQFPIADVGQNNIEEVDLGVSGGNFGWNRKEGSFLFNPANGTISDDPAPDPALLNPIAQYSHTDGSAVIGGYVSRGGLLPSLNGAYVFGELNGRLFYTSLADGVIRELRLGMNDAALGANVKGMGQDNRGEVYALVDSNIGPSGTGGRVLKLTTIPPVAAVSRKLHNGTAFDIDLLTTTPATEPRDGAYQVVFTFAGPVAVMTAITKPDTGATGSVAGQPLVVGNQVVVDLTNVSNAQLLTVSLIGVTNGGITRDVSVQIGVLIGDTNSDGTVNSADATITRNRSGQTTDGTNFHSDYNLDGFINSADATIVRARSGTMVPP
ncbi:MAG: PQQ-dependent sugar dehydrogenase [Chthoniobacterales bacterium]